MSAYQLEITYPPELPVSQRRDDIAAAIRDHQVVIVLAGETGSGKTTQLPEDLPRARPRRVPTGGIIGHTQPRRIAARSVAERIADELGTELGDLVGYQVRFTDRTSKASRVKLMTDGILLAELQRDRDLRRYDTIIIDEAHERVAQHRLPARLPQAAAAAAARPQAHHHQRHDRRRAVRRALRRARSSRCRGGRTRSRSATGRSSSCRRRTRRASRSSATRPRRSWTRCASSVAEGPGDVLVFLPGEREIRDTADALADTATDRDRAALLAGSRRPSSTGCSRRTPAAASCSPRTSPRPR